MAFRLATSKTTVPVSPDLLFRELPRRLMPDVLPHQRDILQEYAKSGLKEPDLAIQLPTGSGKTLVGLLIAEWNLRKNRERVIYVCPTTQLVNQVVAEANTKYGLSVVGLTGSHKEYAPDDKASYEQADKVAITNYSSLFNSDPYFKTSNLIILDDAHASENYIAKMWSLSIDRTEEKHQPLHAAVVNLLEQKLAPSLIARVRGQVDDRNWIDKLPTPQLLEIKNQFIEILDVHKEGAGLTYRWSGLRDHVHACQLYFSSREILLRPIIPPTWSHDPFNHARQRIYMSATLGQGGDLERLMGKNEIRRQAAPPGMESQGVGRRFFMFPSMSLNEDEVGTLGIEMIKRAERTLVLVPSDAKAILMTAAIQENTGYRIFGPKEIEKSKADFVASPKAVAVLANRYDGIDFPGDECRLLLIEGFPKATNLQERFLMSRLAANVLYHERVQTRVVQAIGRCTRSLLDRSVVVLLGDELPDSLGHPQRRLSFHPTLQAELAFGIAESRKRTISEFVDNFSIFLRNGPEWEAANRQIEGSKMGFTQRLPQALTDLTKSVKDEVLYQEALWNSDFPKALRHAENVLVVLNEPSLRGYRALWHYLAGCAAWMGKGAQPTLETKAKEHFAAAKTAATSVSWLADLAVPTFTEKEEAVSNENCIVAKQLERVETIYETLGTLHTRRFAEREATILKGLNDNEATPFEMGVRELGELLGFSTGKIETEASPDPWWRLGDYVVIVFEAHSKGKPEGLLSADKARQAMSHPDWIRMYEPVLPETEVICVTISPAQAARPGAAHILHRFSFWSLKEFREWATNALARLRDLHATFVEPGDLVWKTQAMDCFRLHRMDAPGIVKFLKENSADIALPVAEKI